MSSGTDSRARTIMLRLWYERSKNQADEEWRGEARDVLTGRVTYFRRLSGLVMAVGRLLRDDESPADPSAVEGPPCA